MCAQQPPLSPAAKILEQLEPLPHPRPQSAERDDEETLRQELPD